MSSLNIQLFLENRMDANAYFCYIFSKNIPNRMPVVSEDMVKSSLVSIKDSIQNSFVYLLDKNGKQITKTYHFEGDYADDLYKTHINKPYFYDAVYQKRCIISDPYPSSRKGGLIATASYPIYDESENLKFIACIDMSITNIVNMSTISTTQKAVNIYFKYSYAIFALALFAVALLLFIHGIQSFFVKEISLSHLAIDDMFKATILLTLSLAIFDLAKTLIEEEVFGSFKEHNISGPHKTMVKFLGSIIIALSIEALMLVFKFAITDPDRLLSAIYIIAGVSLLLVCLAVYIRLTNIKILKRQID